MKSVGQWLFLLFGVVAIAGGTYMLGKILLLSWRARRASQPSGWEPEHRLGLALVLGDGVFFLVVGALAVIVFALEDASLWAVIGVGVLFFARAVTKNAAGRALASPISKSVSNWPLRHPR
jgi:hypothetical protein